MPFPPKQVLLDYLKLYELERADNRASWGTALKTFGERALKPVVGNPVVIDELTKRLTEIRTAIDAAENAKTDQFEAWLRLVFRLRLIAKECNELTTTSNESLLCKVLHGLASLILRGLQNNPEFKVKLEAEIATRIKLVNDEQARRKTIRDSQNGSDIEKTITKIKDGIRELAELSVMEYVDEAANTWHLFDYLPKRDEREISALTTGMANNIGLIECQPEYDRILYVMMFQKIKNIGYDEFRQNSIDKAAKNKEAQERQEREAAAAQTAVQTVLNSVADNLDTDPADSSASSPAPAHDRESATIATAALSSSSSSSPSPAGNNVSRIGAFAPKPAAAKKNMKTVRDAANDDTSASAAATAASPRK